jgi:hypothetical protein
MPRAADGDRAGAGAHIGDPGGVVSAADLAQVHDAHHQVFGLGAGDQHVRRDFEGQRVEFPVADQIRHRLAAGPPLD